jgi:transcriptional regulator with XRE-family HTH domain
MILGSKIKTIREMKNFTQEYVAERLEMSQSNYSRIERNEINIPIKTLQTIADIFDITLTELIEFDAKYFFNQVNNQTINGDIKNQTNSELMQKAYDDHIQSLNKEIEHLRGMISELMKKI